MAIRTIAQIKKQIVADILALRTDVKLVVGDPQYDMLVAAPSIEYYRYEVLLEFENRTRNLEGFAGLVNDEVFKQTIATAIGKKQDGTLYTIEDVNILIATRLDAYVKDFNVIRSDGTKATTIVRVYLISSDAVGWNTATTFTSRSGAEYVATSAVGSVTPNFDSDLGLYYVDIPVIASVTGFSGNAVAGALTAMSPKPASFSNCRNLSAADGGSDAETDLDLIDRAEEVWIRRTNGSLGALETLAEEQDYVDDALALNADNNEEEIYIGSPCDIITQFVSEDTLLAEEIFYWPGSGSSLIAETFAFITTNQPILPDVTPTVFRYLIAGNVEEQVTSTDAAIAIVQDTSSFSGSVKANDYVGIDMIHDTSIYTRRLKIIYAYDNQAAKLQQVFDNRDNRIVGPNYLVRKAKEIPIRVIVEPEISFGFDEGTVQANIISNLQIYFNGGVTTYGYQFARKKLGQDLIHTDIINVILKTEGVASFDTDTFFVINTVSGRLDDPTLINDNQYATLFDVLFDFSTANLSNFTASAS